VRTNRESTQIATINDFRGIGVDRWWLNIWDGRGWVLQEATLSNVKLTFASTACGPSGAGSPMYPEWETFPFLEWGHQPQGGAQMAKHVHSFGEWRKDPIIRESNGREFQKESRLCDCGETEVRSVNPRKVTDEDAATTARIRARLKEVW